MGETKKRRQITLYFIFIYLFQDKLPIVQIYLHTDKISLKIKRRKKVVHLLARNLDRPHDKSKIKIKSFIDTTHHYNLDMKFHQTQYLRK